MSNTESLQQSIQPLTSAAVAVVGQQLSAINRAIMVDDAGTIIVDMLDTGNNVSLKLFPGVIYPLRIRRVVSASINVTVLW